MLTHEEIGGTSTPTLLAGSRHASLRSFERYARPAPRPSPAMSPAPNQSPDDTSPNANRCFSLDDRKQPQLHQTPTRDSLLSGNVSGAEPAAQQSIREPGVSRQ